MAYFVSNMKANSAQAHHLRSRHALRENGCHRHVVSSMYCHWISCKRGETRQESCTSDFMVCMEMSIWVPAVSEGGPPRTAATERNKQKVDELIKWYRRMSEKWQRSLEWGTMRSRRWWRFWDIGKFVPEASHCTSYLADNSKEQLGTALPSTPQSGFGPLRLPLVRALERSPERSPLRDWRGNPGSRAKLIARSWNGLLPQRNLLRVCNAGRNA
jgi:hypothetical protein